MKTIKKKININDFLCKTINKSGNISTYDTTTMTWGNDKSYNKVVADIINPFYVEGTYGIKGMKYISHKNMLSILQKLINFQEVVYYICRNCSRETIFNDISIYITLIDDYIIYNGNQMLIFTNTYLDKISKYYKVNDDKNFLQFVCDNKNITLTELIDKLNTLGYNYTTNSLLQEYNGVNDKFDYVYNIFLLYNQEDKIDVRDNYDIIEYYTREDINKLGIDFIDYVVTCEYIDIDKYQGTYTYNREVFLSIPVNILHEFSDIGIMSSYLQEWKPKKRYYLGDIVLFDGKTYILTSGGDQSVVSNGYYIGDYNEITKETYFDSSNRDSDGFFNGYIMYDNNTINPNGNDFKHWKRNIIKRSDSTFINKTSVIDSQLNALKAYRKDTSIVNFFDVDGIYKVGLKFNNEEVGDNLYYSYIKDKQVSLNNNDGHDTVTYTYVIGKCDTNGDNGVEYVETFHRYKIGDNQYTYNFEDLPTATFLIYNKNNINGLSQPLIVDGIGQKNDEKIFNNSNSFKYEYLMNIVSEPKLDVQVNIDRGINGAWERHLKLGEIQILDDLVSYGNGFFNVKENNE